MTVDNNQLKLLASLKSEPGYLLLCDRLQSTFDDVTDDLGNREHSDVVLAGKVRYWQAFRAILHQVRSDPATFAAEAQAGRKDGTLPETLSDEIRLGLDWRETL